MLVHSPNASKSWEQGRLKPGSRSNPKTRYLNCHYHISRKLDYEAELDFEPRNSDMGCWLLKWHLTAVPNACPDTSFILWLITILLCIPHCAYSFMYQSTFGWFPLFSYCECCCYGSCCTLYKRWPFQEIVFCIPFTWQWQTKLPRKLNVNCALSWDLILSSCVCACVWHIW